MKKLFALLLSAAIIFSLSAVGFASPVTLQNLAEDIEVEEGVFAQTDDNGNQSIVSTTYDADKDEFVTTVEGLLEQATILVYIGTRLQVGTSTLTEITDVIIKYIDQIPAVTDGQTIFTYKLKDGPVAGQVYTVAVGGSNVDTVIYQEVLPVEGESGADIGTIEGTVMFNGGTFAATYTLTATDAGGEVAPIVTASSNFSLADIPVGTYTLVITRKANTKITITNIPVTADGTTTIPGIQYLYGGDYNDSDKVDVYDYAILIDAYNKTNSDVSLNDDEKVDVYDYAILIDSYNKSSSSSNYAN